MEEYHIIAKLQYMDLVRFFEAHDFTKEVSETVADYLTSCIDFELDLNNYVWNILPFYVQIFNSKEEAIEYRNSNYSKEYWEDCQIYVCENGKVYFEGC